MYGEARIQIGEHCGVARRLGRWGAALLSGLAVLLVVVAPLPGCRKSTPAPNANRTRTIVVTIFPLYDVVSQLADSTITVELLLPASVSPHGYALSPADVKKLDGADLIVGVGGGLDNWALGAAADREQSGAVQVVRLVDGVVDDGHDHGAHDEHDHGHSHGHGSVNPHQWLVPIEMAEFVGQVSEKMQSLYPNQEMAIRDREYELRMMFAELDVAYEEALEKVADRRVIMFHDAFGPLAERYDVEVVASVLDMDTFTALPARVEAVRRAITEQGVRAVFSEPQFDSAAIQGLVGEATIRMLDPIGGPGVKGYESYEALMRSNLDALVAGMNENVTPDGDDGG